MKKVILSLAFIIFCSSAYGDILPRYSITKQLRGNDKHGKFNIKWVELTPKFKNNVVRKQINKELEKYAKGYICEADQSERERMSSTFEMKVTFLSEQILGVKTINDTFCGGPYPDHSPGSLIFNLRTGRRIEIESEVQDQITFRSFVVKKVLATVPKNSGECKEIYVEEDLKNTGYIYILDNQKLITIQDYPHVSQACAFETEIPYESITKFIKPGSVLETVMQNRNNAKPK